MIIRPYTKADKKVCLDVFESNSPKFFDKEEGPLFEKWLNGLGKNEITYSNAEMNAFYVLENQDSEVIGCGGFYVVKEEDEARLAWGMIHHKYHKMGYGTALYNFRKEEINKLFPNHVITLGTSQHTYAFYEKMGMKVTDKLVSGYGPNLDRYDMTENL